MIALLLAAALADPVVLRGPAPEGALGVSIGSPELSAGGWIRPRLGVAVEARTGGTALGASVGTRATLAGRERPWGIDASLAAGWVLPTVDPALALSLTPALHAGWRGERFQAVLGLAAPLAARLAPRPDLRAPVLVEPWLGLRLGDVWLGARAGLGVVAAPGWAPSIVGHASLGVATCKDPRPWRERRTSAPTRTGE